MEFKDCYQRAVCKGVVEMQIDGRGTEKGVAEWPAELREALFVLMILQTILQKEISGKYIERVQDEEPGETLVMGKISNHLPLSSR
jgi:hypothetical protein